MCIHNNMYDHQDWAPVVIHSKTHHQLERQKKQNAAGTKRFNELNDDDIPALKKITQEQKQALIDARNAKGLDRAGLAKLVPYLDVKTIEKYENGTVTNFDKALYNKMLRALGVKPEK